MRSKLPIFSTNHHGQGCQTGRLVAHWATTRPLWRPNINDGRLPGRFGKNNGDQLGDLVILRILCIIPVGKPVKLGKTIRAAQLGSLGELERDSASAGLQRASTGAERVDGPQSPTSSLPFHRPVPHYLSLRYRGG